MTIRTPNHLPVHCCCEPSKRLGWVRIDGALEPRRIRFCTEHASYALMGARGVSTPADPNRWPADARFMPARYIDTEIAPLRDNGMQFLAVKSAHASVDEWQKVVGFIADDRAGHDPTGHVCVVDNNTAPSP